jgi:hypothetical protein
MVCSLVLAAAVASAQSAQPAPKPAAPAPAKAAVPQRTFDTPQAAADALIAATATYDVPALEAILGPDGKSLVVTKDPVQDKNSAEAFAAKAREKNAIVPDAKDPNRVTLSIGNEDWPMPIPIVRKNGKWLFDSKAGAREVLYRRIGSNELNAIAGCRNYVEAQHEYALEQHAGSSVNQYAQKLISSPGQQDGLAWGNPDGTSGGPLGDDLARAITEGYTKRDAPFHGYYFKVLKGQGPAAPIGQIDFVIKGVMIGGFALAAAPAEYLVTGVKTFIVSHDGIVYEKDLGEKTLETFQKMDRYNPGKGWVPSKDQD